MYFLINFQWDFKEEKKILEFYEKYWLWKNFHHCLMLQKRSDVFLRFLKIINFLFKQFHTHFLFFLIWSQWHKLYKSKRRLHKGFSHWKKQINLSSFWLWLFHSFYIFYSRKNLFTCKKPVFHIKISLSIPPEYSSPFDGCHIAAYTFSLCPLMVFNRAPWSLQIYI